jgi:hypothetical protein
MYLNKKEFPLHIYLGDQNLLVESILQEKGVFAYQKT